MERDEVDPSASKVSPERSQALNSTILDYYKKFGRKRDLEQYFSLNTAEGDVKDVSSLFWRRMKSQDSSDSGEKSIDTSLEICRIQIKCSSVDLEPGTSQNDSSRNKSDTESPPIITEEAPKPLEEKHSDDESEPDDKSVKSDDYHSQKSNDAVLDTSLNKAYSPSSSITSQRKLEWDSLADVGYANESDKRTSASSLSTLERLALQQQYSNSDTHRDKVMGPPTAHSTPVDDTDIKVKSKKGSKSTKIYTKDVERVEVDVPHCSDSNIPQQSINVNLTKHISFSVDKSGGISVGDVKKDFSVSPEKTPEEIKLAIHETEDKEIQTSLIRTKDKSSSSGEIPRPHLLYGQGVPVLINLNNLKKRQRRRKVSVAKKKLRMRKKLDVDKENIPVHEKSGEQVSDAESFEYMPGHIYNQNQMSKKPATSNQTAGNKSSLESSNAATTDSSKESKLSFHRDLENGIKLLKSALKNRYDDTELKQKLIKEVVQKLLKTNYRDDETSTEFLSGLSFSSKKLGLGEGNNTTTSTSDANNTAEKAKLPRPKKSILRVDKFNPNAIASTSQSVPNLPTMSNSNNPISTNLFKILTTSNSLSDASSKEKTSSDTAFAKTSSEELYIKYLDALRREEAYKKHLREKEQFLKQKLVASDTAFRTIPAGPAAGLDVKSRLKLKELMKDLTRNNYDDGSGDASKLEGAFTSDAGLRDSESNNQRRHSVFTLSSSGNSDHSRKSNLKKSALKDMFKAGHSKETCCPHHSVNRVGVTDSSVQVNIRHTDEAYLGESVNVTMKPASPAKSKPVTHIVSDDNTGEVKYLCFCNTEGAETQNQSDNFMIYKCSRLTSQGICCDVPNLPKEIISKSHNHDSEKAKPSKGSQTCIKIFDAKQKDTICIHEAVRVIQTDISINPRISDPSLSDIRITNNSDCVKLIREQFRQVSKSSIESNANDEQSAAQAFVVSNQPGTSNTYLRKGKADDMKKKTVDIETQSYIDMKDREIQPQPSYRSLSSDGYTIPIEGTNMSLKVRVGSNPVTDEVMEITKRNNGVGTDVVGTVENATCLTEECSIGVQSENRNLFSQYDLRAGTVNTIFSKPAYPAQSNPLDKNKLQRKPYLRSNTFAGIEEGYSSARQEILDDIYDHEHWFTYPKTSTYGKPILDFNKHKVLRCFDPINREPKKYTDSDNRQVYKEYVASRESVLTLDDAVVKVNTSCGPDEIEIDSCMCVGNSEFGNKCECKVKDAANQKLANEEIIEIDSSKDGRYNQHADINKQTSLNTCPCPVSEKSTRILIEQKSVKNIEAYDTKAKIGSPRLMTKKPCPCAVPSECGNHCPENAECWSKKKQEKTVTQNVTDRSSEETDSPRSKTKKPCPCPVPSECGNCCPEYMDCWKNRNEEEKIVRQIYATDESGADSNFARAKIKKPCPCPVHADCDNYCQENADCWTKRKGERTGSSYSASEKSKRIAHRDSPAENSDSDYLDFQKLKEYLGNRTYPGQTKKPEPNSKRVRTTDSYEIMNLIKEVTDRYTKKDIQKCDRKKCFKEIVSILNYLLDTEDPTGIDAIKDLRNLVAGSSGSYDCNRAKSDKAEPNMTCMVEPKITCAAEPKKTCDKGIQLSTKKSKKCPESSDLQTTSEIPCTSSDSVTCKVLSKIRNECEKYHRKCCKHHHSKKLCQCSSTSSMSCEKCKRIILCQCMPVISANCEKCKRVHHCQCRSHNRCKCKNYKPKSVSEKFKKKCVAYNLILQTSDSMMCDNFETNCRPLKNIIVKVPPTRPSTCNIPFREMEAKIGKYYSAGIDGRGNRSRSLPNDSISSTDDCVKGTVLTVKDYLEQNRPDFIEQSGHRQKCLKMISEARANNRSAQRKLLSMQVQVEPTLRALSESDLQALAREIGIDLRQRREPPKLISEREMKNHSKKIYKKLPEVVQKKEDLKKENIKKTNLLLANIFKKNLQKKTLRGSVNLPNYKTVVTI